jgi:predicted RecB family nuclease
VKVISQQLRLAATDVSNHLACHHLTHLELSVARGERPKPEWKAPDLVVIQELGLRHEAKYLAHLKESGLEVLNLTDSGSERYILEETQRAMEQGVDVIAQGALGSGRWLGRPDALRKVGEASRFGNWSYEAYDCKLARETKATTILQLSFYSELLGEIQGVDPESMWVVAPGHAFAGEAYRVAEYGAYYRYVKAELEKVCVDGHAEETYPEPCAHCDVCRWFRECDARLRRDDHLSLVAGIRRLQRNQLEAWDRKTVARLAEMPIPLQEKPLHGSRDGMVRVREQARVQVEGRTQQRAVHELLDVIPEMGFCRLPECSSVDMFVDLEGDPFAGDVDAGGGQEYLFGFVSMGDGGATHYDKRWALTAEEEKTGFEWLVDEVIWRWKKVPEMHVYHFGAYEPSAFKRLMGRYATREDEVDGMLRAGVFVDLHTVLKQAIRVSVEEYSLKKLEALYGFERKTPPDESREAMRYIEHRLQLGWKGELPGRYRDLMEGYNGEDCFSTAALRDWLEAERVKAMAAGAMIARPALGNPTPTDNVKERVEKVNALIAALTSHLSPDRTQWKPIEKRQWLLAQLLDWHRRENKATCWEYYRLADMDDNALLDERSALVGLQFVRRTPPVGRGRLPVDTYSYPSQDTDVREGDKVAHKKLIVGTVESIDLRERTIDIKKTGDCLDLHPSSIFVDSRGPNWEVLADSTFRIGAWAQNHALDDRGKYQAVRDLLLGVPPRLSAGETLGTVGTETTTETACRVVGTLENSVFAIQGPPGSGKTFTAARMICSLVRQRKKVGVTALSHKVIGKVLKEVQIAADEFGIEVSCIQKIRDDVQDEQIRGVELTRKNELPLTRLSSGACQVAAGTVWMWAREEYAESVDVLFIDEAGQMALADVIAAGRAARNIVLVGDPQQLQRPLKGSHPDGAEKSALEHLIGEQKTISSDQGMLLPLTRRMHSKVCRFTSELFYEGKLHSHPVTEPQRLNGHRWLNAPGLWFIPVIHTGCRNASADEVDLIERLVKGFVNGKVQWLRTATTSKAVTLEDVLIVAPYNAQVSDLLIRLPKGARVGTVDKFQGQEAAVVIYSLTTSSPEDAPRGMEFLYSLNRFNVATSRAMSNVIVVGSSRLFEPECKSPRQMQLANALCRYLELATIVEAPAV